MSIQTTHRARAGQTDSGEHKFWLRVAKGPEGSCWEWLGYCRATKGPIGMLNGEVLDARRIAIALVTEDFGEGRQVKRCPQSRRCVNPAHTGYTLGDEQQAAIREEIATLGTPRRELARRYGVSRETVCRISSGGYNATKGRQRK